MLVLTHAVVGAAAGELLNNPIYAVIAGIILHLLCDKIPHYLPKKFLKIEEFGFGDFLAACGFIYLLFSNNFSESTIWGAIAGISVDVILVPIPAICNSWLGKWHVNRQKHLHDVNYLLRDLALIALSLFILYIGQR